MNATPIPKAKKLATELLTPLIEAGKISKLDWYGPHQKPKDWIIVRVRHPKAGPFQIALGFWCINYSEGGKRNDMRLHFKLENPATPNKRQRILHIEEALAELHEDFEKAVGYPVLPKYMFDDTAHKDRGRDLMFETPFAFKADEIARVFYESVKFFVTRLDLTRY